MLKMFPSNLNQGPQGKQTYLVWDGRNGRVRIQCGWYELRCVHRARSLMLPSSPPSSPSFLSIYISPSPSFSRRRTSPWRAGRLRHSGRRTTVLALSMRSTCPRAARPPPARSAPEAGRERRSAGCVATAAKTAQGREKSLINYQLNYIII